MPILKKVETETATHTRICPPPAMAVDSVIRAGSDFAMRRGVR